MIKSNTERYVSLKKIFSGIALFLVSVFLFSACASSSKYATEAAYPASAPKASSSAAYDVALEDSVVATSGSAKDDGVGEGSFTNQSKENNAKADVMGQRKMIMDGNVSLETLHFDESIVAMDQLIDDFGGFAEVRTVRGKSKYSYALRTASYVIRVPAESFDLVLKNMGSIGSVLESNSKSTDITDSYFDTQTRIKTLKVQEETLLDILSKSTKLEDVITLESRIAEVRYEIESLENTINNYDRLVSFSRITIFIQEVDDRSETKPEPKTLGERISGSFARSLEDFQRGVEDFLVWFVGSWIAILFFLAIIAVLLISFKAYKRRNKRKVQVMAEAPKQEPKE